MLTHTMPVQPKRPYVTPSSAEAAALFRAQRIDRLLSDDEEPPSNDRPLIIRVLPFLSATGVSCRRDRFRAGPEYKMGPLDMLQQM